MAMRLKKIDGDWIAVCAAKTTSEVGDVYIDDVQDHAIRAKIAHDYRSEGLDVPLVSRDLIEVMLFEENHISLQEINQREAHMICDRCDTFGGTKTYQNQVVMPLNGKAVCIDWCIHQIVAALNAAGIYTRSCCCGHGTQDGFIELENGRVLAIKPPEQEKIMNSTEGLTNNEHIEIDGTLEAVLMDLRRRFDAGELKSLEFEAIDCNNNTLSGSALA